MTNTIHFQERQKFTQWWLWLIIIGVATIPLIDVYRKFEYGLSFTEHPRSLIRLAIFQLVPILFLMLKLDTVIKDDGIYIRFFPFHREYRFLPQESMTKSYVREYSPITEYGGWGIKFGIARIGRVYNVAGDEGLQLEFDNGSELLIGTQKAEELKQVLLNIKQLKE